MNNTNTYTDQQLQLALAKMLPEWIEQNCWNRSIWKKKYDWDVQETEWLHVCWLIKQTLTERQWEKWEEAICEVQEVTRRVGDEDVSIATINSCHPTWQEEAIALAKVKRIEIV